MNSSDRRAAKQQRKERERVPREEILSEARENFELEKRRQELKRQRGEDETWLAPGVSLRLGLKEGPSDRKKKKKHKKEHRKHETKHAKRKSYKTEEVSSDESSGEEHWVDMSVEQPKPSFQSQKLEEEQPLKRDDWMMIPMASSALSVAKLTQTREAEMKIEKRDELKLHSLDKPGQHPRELNPYWKDGGTGLPSQKEARQSEGSKTGASQRYKPRFGDGGRSWMLRAYKRAIEQAELEGRSLEEIAAERWGSLEKLHSLLETAGIDPKKTELPPRSGKRQYLYSQFSPEEKQWKEDSWDRKKGERREHNHRERESSSSRSATSGFMRPGGPDSKLLSGSLGMGQLGGGGPSNWRKKGAKEEPQTQIDNKNGERERESRSPCVQEIEMEEDGKGVHRKSPGPQTNIEVHREPITDSRLNALGAKVMKAEMMGDVEKCRRLKKELEELQRLKVLQETSQHGGEGGRSQKRNGKEDRIVVLTKTDRFGRTKPLELPSSSGYKPPATRTKKGKREKFFGDDDQYSLRALIEQERMTTAEETHAMIAHMASKFVPASNAGETVDDAIESMQYNPAKEEERKKQRAIMEGRKMTEVLENCRFCFDNPNFNKHLMVAMGMNVYLTVPAYQSLTEGHCLLVPMEHAVCSMILDENIWSEIKIFQKGLTRMFADRDMDVVFMETYTSTKRKSHMQIECIPIPREQGELAPMYFKKAIMESDEEWSENKKLIDTRKKGVRTSIPAGLPYFFVDFGLDGGFAHIIENQTKFPHYFGHEVVGGMLDTDPRLWLKPPKESFEGQKSKVLQLSEWWKPYDWTQRLRE